MEVDFNRVAMLLGIVEKIPSVAPGYTHISSVAMAELKGVNDAIKDEAVALQQARAKGEVAAPAKALTAQDVEGKDPNETKAQPVDANQPATDPANPERRL